MDEDLITSIKEEKGGAIVEVNGEEKLWFSRAPWLERQLREGETVDLNELKKWLLPRQYAGALDNAVSFLAVRARSVGEVRQKLEMKRYMEETIEMVLYKLEKERLVDDEAFAREWAELCSKRQMGKRRILFELRQKGISSELAELAVNGLDLTETDEAAVLLAQRLLKRYLNEPDPRKAMNKLLAAMARRGYGFEDSKNAVDEAMRREQEDE